MSNDVGTSYPKKASDVSLLGAQALPRNVQAEPTAARMHAVVGSSGRLSASLGTDKQETDEHRDWCFVPVQRQ